MSCIRVCYCGTCNTGLECINHHNSHSHPACDAAQDAFDDQPLVSLLQAEGLSKQLQDIIMHGIAYCDLPQLPPATSSHTATISTDGPPAAQTAGCITSDSALPYMSAREGKQALQLYAQSVGRYSGQGAFMVPAYGSGSLPEAFVRLAAVHGAVTVLRQGVVTLTSKHHEQGNGNDGNDRNDHTTTATSCCRVTMASGQVIQCDAVVGNVEVLRGEGSTADCSTAPEHAGYKHFVTAVCVCDRPLCEGNSSMLIVFPPGSLGDSQQCVIRGLQLGAAAHVAPMNHYLLYLSADVTSMRASLGAEDTPNSLAEAVLKPAVRSLLQTTHLPGHASTAEGISSSPPPPPSASLSSEGCEQHSTLDLASSMPASARSAQPTAQAVVYYSQQECCTAPTHLPANVVACCTVDHGLVGYQRVMHHTEQLFRKHFPGVPWLSDDEPQAPDSDPVAEDDDYDAIDDLTMAVQGLQGLGSAGTS